MKTVKYIGIILLLLISAIGYAQDDEITIVVGQPTSAGEAPAAFCSSCGTGATPIFCWGISLDDTVITNSDGCSQGDTTGSLASQAVFLAAPSPQTGYVIQLGATGSGAYDGCLFTVSSADIWNDQAGTIEVMFYVPSTGGFVAGTSIFEIIAQTAEDRFYLQTSGTDELQLLHEGANAGATYITTTAANIVTDTWYTATIKWTTADVSPNLSLSCNGNTVTSNTNLTAFDTAITQMSIGNALDGTNGYIYIKSIKIWDSWQ